MDTNLLGFGGASFFSAVGGITDRGSSNKGGSRGRSLNKEIGIL